jgi:hypothetical protein
MVAAAVQWAKQIMKKIDEECGRQDLESDARINRQVWAASQSLLLRSHAADKRLL